MKKERLFWGGLFLATIAVYIIIYICFKGSRGFLPGIGLGKSDWLSFLGDYLGFASSTLLAIAVFKQDRKINGLLSSEYEPLVIFSVLEYERLWNTSGEKGNSRFIVIQKNLHKLLFEQFVFDPESSIVVSENIESPFRFYFSIENKGKLPIHALTINKIDLDDDLCVYKKDIDTKNLVINSIQPNSVKNVCIKLNKFPHANDETVHTLQVHYSVSISEGIIYNRNYELLFTGDETTLFDGIDYHRK